MKFTVVFKFNNSEVKAIRSYRGAHKAHRAAYLWLLFNKPGQRRFVSVIREA